MYEATIFTDSNLNNATVCYNISIYKKGKTRNKWFISSGGYKTERGALQAARNMCKKLGVKKIKHNTNITE